MIANFPSWDITVLLQSGLGEASSTVAQTPQSFSTDTEIFPGSQLSLIYVVGSVWNLSLPLYHLVNSYSFYHLPSRQCELFFSVPLEESSLPSGPPHTVAQVIHCATPVSVIFTASYIGIHMNGAFLGLCKVPI